MVELLLGLPATHDKKSTSNLAELFSPRLRCHFQTQPINFNVKRIATATECHVPQTSSIRSLDESKSCL